MAVELACAAMAFSIIVAKAAESGFCQLRRIGEARVPTDEVFLEAVVRVRIMRQGIGSRAFVKGRREEKADQGKVNKRKVAFSVVECLMVGMMAGLAWEGKEGAVKVKGAFGLLKL